MTTDKAATNISYNSAVNGGGALILWSYSESSAYDGSWYNDDEAMAFSDKSSVDLQAKNYLTLICCQKIYCPALLKML